MQGGQGGGGGKSGNDGSEEDEEKEKVVESFLVLVSEIPGQRVGCVTLRGGGERTGGRSSPTHRRCFFIIITIIVVFLCLRQALQCLTFPRARMTGSCAGFS